MRRRTITIYSILGIIATTIALFFMLNMTNPTDSGPMGMLTVLLLVYGLAYSVIILFAMLFGYIYRLIMPKPETTTSVQRYRRGTRKTLAICAVLAATPMLIISLNSIGRMGFVDIALIAATECVAVFYIAKKM